MEINPELVKGLSGAEFPGRSTGYPALPPQTRT